MSRRFLPLTALVLTLSACSRGGGDGQADGASVRLAIPSDNPPLEAPPAQPEGTVWARGAGGEALFGVPGAPALLTIACIEDPALGPRLRFARFTRAPAGAKALFALEGNRHVARVPLDVVTPGDPGEWRGDYDPALETALALKGPLEIKATLPGGGTLVLAPSPLPGEVLDSCRARLPASAVTPAPPPEPAPSESP